MGKKKKKPFDSGQHFVEFKSLFSMEPSLENWRKVCMHLEEIPDEFNEEQGIFLDYAEENLSYWPNEIRLPTYTWWRAQVAGTELPVHRIISNFNGDPLVTVKDVEHLAPDEKAFKATKTVAKESKWEQYGRDKEGLWGIAKGSSSDYYVVVNVRARIFNCSCPSRKLPCKHSLALAMLEALGIKIPNTNAPNDHRANAEPQSYGTWE